MGTPKPALRAAPLNLRRLLVFVHDVVAAAAAWMLAYWLRFNLDIPSDFLDIMLERLPTVIAVHAAIFCMLGL